MVNTNVQVHNDFNHDTTGNNTNNSNGQNNKARTKFNVMDRDIHLTMEIWLRNHDHDKQSDIVHKLMIHQYYVILK